MKRLQSTIAPVLVIFFILFVSQAQAQFWKNWVGEKGNGNVVTETRNVSSFNKIKAASGITVYFETGPQSVKVTTDENLQQLIQTTVKNNRLVIKRKNQVNIKKATKLEVRVSTPVLYEVESSSGADFTARGTIKSDRMSVSSSSGADLTMKLNVKTLTVNSSSGADMELSINSQTVKASASSGADIELKGTAKSANLSASSGADIDAYELSVERCEASASSAGDITITVKNELRANASSGGDVGYKGSPGTVNRSTSSGGDVSAH